ncbi:MAG: nickel pincer cofactor biosynthesis protein LarC [Armatimonadota bacterium]|nr:nickel pincer cofactor biosynthesis protein LarC [Armatimonadota bacterium]
MRIAYFDCFAGISGDMTLGALIAAGADIDSLRERLSSLSLGGYEIEAKQVRKKGIAATDVNVVLTDEQHERRLGDIVEIIGSSSLPDGVKDRSVRVFEKLAEAEGRVHGCPANRVHFHEVGAVDAIVDIVGTAICLDLLKVDRVEASPLPMPHGFVEAAHGRFPLPAPATAELLKGVPIRGVDVEGELVTPTGAAILSALASRFGPMPDFRLEAVGYGAGKSEYDFPNALRALIGESEDGLEIGFDPLIVLETNVDDMNPQFFDSAMERLFAMGARDVYLTPIQMKKNRPATLLNVLCDRDNMGSMLSIIFAETSTLGVRIQEVRRACMEREWRTVETRYGPIRIKIGSVGGEIRNSSPEYEDCRAAAAQYGVPTKVVYEEAVGVFRRSEE